MIYNSISCPAGIFWQSLHEVIVEKTSYDNDEDRKNFLAFLVEVCSGEFRV